MYRLTINFVILIFTIMLITMVLYYFGILHTANRPEIKHIIIMTGNIILLLMFREVK